jgi:hypothetical protein
MWEAETALDLDLADCRDGSRLRFTEQRGDSPQKGEIYSR